MGALQTLQSHQAFDLVLSDVCMDGMNGIDLLRARGRESPEAWAFYTGADDDVRKGQAFDAGAIAYWLKPMSPSDLRVELTGIAEFIALRTEMFRPSHPMRLVCV